MKRLLLFTLLASCGSPKRDAQEVKSPSQAIYAKATSEGAIRTVVVRGYAIRID